MFRWYIGVNEQREWYQNLIEAEGLSKKFGRTTAVHDVTLEIRKGENVCVIGPNSAGKTTLLLMLGGVHFPTTGSIRVMGMDRFKENPEIHKRSTFLTADVIVGTCPTPYEYLRFYAQGHGSGCDSSCICLDGKVAAPRWGGAPEL